MARRKAEINLFLPPKCDGRTFSSQDQLQSVNLVTTILSFVEEIVGDGGCKLINITRRHDAHRIPRSQNTNAEIFDDIIPYTVQSVILLNNPNVLKTSTTTYLVSPLRGK